MNSNSKCNACSDEEVFLGGIGQRPKRRRAFLIRQAGEFRGVVVPIRHTVRIGAVGVRIGHAGAWIGIVVANHNVARTLLNIRQTIGVVEGVDDLGLPHHRHRGAS